MRGETSYTSWLHMVLIIGIFYSRYCSQQICHYLSVIAAVTSHEFVPLKILLTGPYQPHTMSPVSHWCRGGWRVHELETTMESPITATLHISLVTSQLYRVLYTVSNGSGGAATPYSIDGQAPMKAFLRQCGLNTAEIDMII